MDIAGRLDFYGVFGGINLSKGCLPHFLLLFEN